MIRFLNFRAETLRRVASCAEAGGDPGSFYGHFRIREELRDRVIRHWRDQMLRRGAAAGPLAGRGAEQIRRLPHILVTRRLPHLDAAMRVWALEDTVVAAPLTR